MNFKIGDKARFNTTNNLLVLKYVNFDKIAHGSIGIIQHVSLDSIMCRISFEELDSHISVQTIDLIKINSLKRNELDESEIYIYECLNSRKVLMRTIAYGTAMRNTPSISITSNEYRKSGLRHDWDWTITEASLEDRQWLKVCEKHDKFIPKDLAVNEFQCNEAKNRTVDVDWLNNAIKPINHTMDAYDEHMKRMMMQQMTVPCPPAVPNYITSPNRGGVYGESELSKMVGKIDHYDRFSDHLNELRTAMHEGMRIPHSIAIDPAHGHVDINFKPNKPVEYITITGTLLKPNKEKNQIADMQTPIVLRKTKTSKLIIT